MTPSQRIAVFAYGSLVSPRSAAETLGRPALGSWRSGAAVPAALAGWRRRFSQARDNRTCEKTFALDADGSIPDFVLGLNVERTGHRDDLVNGLLIAVSASELERLDVRELRYDRVGVGGEIHPPDGAAGFDRVYAYTAKAAHFAPRPPSGAVILHAYAAAVEAGFAELGPAALRAYRETTGTPPAPLVEAHLVRDRIPPGNPRGW